MCTLTKREAEILTTLIKSDVKATAEKLGITPNSVHTTLYRIRRRRKRARLFLDQINDFSSKSEKLKRLLIPTERILEKWK